MSRSLRFLGVAVAAWAGIRAVSLGMVPGTEMLAIDRPAAAETLTEARPATLPRVETTDLTPPELAAGAPAPAAGIYPPSYPPAYPPPGYPAAYGYPQPPYGSAPYSPAPSPPPSPPVQLRYYIPAGYPAPTYTSAYAPAFAPRRRGQSAPHYAELQDYPGLPYTREPVPALDQWPLSSIASHRSRPVPAQASSPPPPLARFDRLQLTSWAMLRQRPGAASLASNGMLGGSQAGLRLLYRVNRQFAASLRTSAPLGTATRGGEAALGVRYQPFASIPVSLTAERRQSFGKGAGRSAFALFAEGGLWQRPIAAGFALDAYLQGGVVGMRHRDLFVDGAATLTRPLWRGFSVGGGVWGGMQPGLTRIDVGPRLSMKLGRGMRAHLDYRYKAAGNALPGSGAVVTLAGDF